MIKKFIFIYKMYIYWIIRTYHLFPNFSDINLDFTSMKKKKKKKKAFDLEDVGDALPVCKKST